MVTQALSLTRSGLKDFILQRITAVVLAAYAFCMVGFFLVVPVTYASLTDYFWSTPMQFFSTLTAFSIVAHGWIGMWTIGTDYLRPAHVGVLANALRFAYQMICLFILFVYIVWSMKLIWQF